MEFLNSVEWQGRGKHIRDSLNGKKFPQGIESLSLARLINSGQIEYNN